MTPELLTQCCASETWVKGMLAAMPFADAAAVEKSARDVAARLAPDDWLEAFAAHPRIGDVATLRERFANTKELAASEQAGVRQAKEETIAELARLNDAYFEKFGFIFIVFATGKTADEMLAILKSRLPNDPQDELPIAAAEQLKITLLRLEKLREIEP